MQVTANQTHRGPGCYAGDVLVPARLRLSGKQVWRRVRERYKDAWKWVFAGKLKNTGPVSVVVEDKADSQPDEVWEVSGSFSMRSANRVSAH